MRRRLSAFVSLLAIIAVCAARGEAQSVTRVSSAGAIVPASEVAAARAACTLRALGAAGYLVRAHPTDSTRRVLTRTLVGIDLYTGLLSPGDTRVESAEVRLSDGPAGLAVERVSLLRPDTGATQPTARESARADAQLRELLQAVGERCDAR